MSGSNNRVSAGTRQYAVPRGHISANKDTPEPTEYDVTGGLPPGAPTSAETCPEWADGEIGLIARRLMEGATIPDIADDLGLSPGWIVRLRELVRQIRSLGAQQCVGLGSGRNRSTPHRATGQPRHRPRSLEPDQEALARILRYDRKLSISDIARRLKTTDGVIAWCLDHPREEV